MKGRLFRKVTKGHGFLLVVNQAVDNNQCAFREGGFKVALTQDLVNIQHIK